MDKILSRHLLIDRSGAMMASVMVSLGILLVVLVISIPFFRQYQPNMRLAAAARNLTTDLRYAQQLTITDQSPYAVEFNTLLNNYRVILTGAATTTIKTVELPDFVEYQSVSGFTGNLVRFNSYGAVAENGDIILVNSNGQTRMVSVKPSGYVQLVQ